MNTDGKAQAVERIVDAVVRNPCTRCGSINGMFRSFYSHIENREMHYWMCECGRNHGHAPTEDGAVATWNEINPNPSHHAPPLGGGSVDGVVGDQNEGDKR